MQYLPQDAKQTTINQSNIYFCISGVVWNVTVDPLTNWTFHATKVNSFVITSNLDLQLKVENYFNFTLTSDTSAFLSFNIVNNSLDKEDTFWRNTVSRNYRFSA